MTKVKEEGKAEGRVPLAATGLAPSVLAALLGAGFQSVADVTDLSARELANGTSSAPVALLNWRSDPPHRAPTCCTNGSEARMGVREAAAALEELQRDGRADALGQSALQVLQQAASKRPLSLFVGDLDAVLGGGLPRGEITEICGGPGTGKTQLAIHASLAAQYALDSGESKASSIFIDSEGSFVIERVAEMAARFCEDFPAVEGAPRTRDDLLRGISYYRVHDFVEQMEVVHALGSLLREAPECKLVVLDTAAFHFRHGFDDYSQRLRALDDLASCLHSIASEFHVCILLTNHMTSKSTGARAGGASGASGSPFEAPALGDSWSHSITNRVVLAWEAGTRVARVAKSPSMAHDAAAFQVSERGVRSGIQ